MKIFNLPSQWRQVLGSRSKKVEYQWTSTQFDLLEVAYCIWSQKSVSSNQAVNVTFCDVCKLLCPLFGVQTPPNPTSSLDKMRHRAHIRQSSYLLKGFKELYPGAKP